MTKPAMTGLQMAIERAGGIVPLAKLLRTRSSTIQQWLDLDGFPRYTTPDSAVLRVIDAATGGGPLARALGVTHQAVAEWRRQGWMPPKRAVQCEKLYGVPARELVSPKLRAVEGGA